MMTIIMVLVFSALVHVVWFTIGLNSLPDYTSFSKLKWYKRLLVSIIYVSPVMGVLLFTFALLLEFSKPVKFRLPKSFSKWLLEE